MGSQEPSAPRGESDPYIAQLRSGGEESLAELFSRHRQRLWRMVAFRLDPRLRGRVDADDVLQEAYLNASQRLAGFLEEPRASFFIWLRRIVFQTLIDTHRRHLGAQARDAAREVAIQGPAPGFATSASMAIQLAGSLTSPSGRAMRGEMLDSLRDALEEMSPTDREVLALRHFEELSNGEVAEVLEIGVKAASIRYIRALERLRKILGRFPGFQEIAGPRPGSARGEP